MSLAPYVRSNGGVHPVVDRPLLLSTFRDATVSPWVITSGVDLASWEKLRSRHGIDASGGIPCDVFLWGTGPAPDPRLTRIGGVPWLPKREPWPVVDGVVTNFLCQFDFRDSRDLSGQRVARGLPGDLLLVFATDWSATFVDEGRGLRFVWAMAEEIDVISAEELPRPTHPIENLRPTWGARFRSADYPERWDFAFEISDRRDDDDLYRLPVLQGTKIGGVPHHSQEIQRTVKPGYLCQLVSVQAALERPWPWIDRESPIGSRAPFDEANGYLIGDMGELTIYLDDEGEITVESAF